MYLITHLLKLPQYRTSSVPSTVSSTAPTISFRPSSVPSSRDPTARPSVYTVCPVGYSNFKGHCYRFNNQSLLSWQQASSRCVSEGGYLASIASLDENSYIQSIISSAAWIGLNDIASDTVWVWSNGEPTNYTNWDQG